MTKSREYDAIVVGTGQGGKPLAKALAESGRRTAIVERADRVGGTCVLWGCTPTKTMVASARVAYLARRAREFGVRIEGLAVDPHEVRQRTREIVETFSSGSRKGLEGTESLDLIFGAARFIGPHRLEVDTNETGELLLLEAPEIFLNVGARPRIPDVPGLDAVKHLDSSTILELAETPEHLLVIGAGPVGLEFAQMFRRFGSAVTLLDRGERLLRDEDEEFGDALAECLREDGIELVLGADVLRVEGGDPVALTARVAGEERTFHGSHLLVAGGRKPNTDTLNAEAAGLELTPTGHIRVDARLVTSVPGVWALGDAAGSPPFTHAAYDDFRIVSDNLLHGGSRTTADRVVPYVVYTDPQFGRVGLSERQAKERGLRYDTAKLPMSSVARALETSETRGLLKAIVERDTERILGAAVLGVEGGELMSMIQIAMLGDLPFTALRDGIFAHPTFAEALNNLFGEL